MDPTFFATPDAWRAWLARHHAKAEELWVGFHKRGTGRASITWPESVDQALCYGWIDGVRKSLGPESYAIRFTPRRQGSTWSKINLNRVGELEALGLMQPAGRAAHAARTAAKSGIYGTSSAIRPGSPRSRSAPSGATARRGGTSRMRRHGIAARRPTGW